MKTRLLIFILFGYFFVQNIVAQVKIATQDSLALVALFDSTQGTQWIKSWNKNNPISTWSGITTQAGRVTVINLPSNKLVGKLPPSFGNLNKLQELYLMGNNLTGPLPESIWSINSLRKINLQFNQFSGSISKSIGQLRQLESLVLTGNSFSGPLPAEIGQLSSLSIFKIFSNQFSDTIPSTFAALTNLSEFAINANKFTGKLPLFIANFKYLWQLHLHYNDFNGTIPPSYGNLINLRELYLSDNRQLTGSIPASFGNLNNLNLLGISNTEISGTIPTTLGKLNALQTLYLNGNPNLGGAIPVELGNLRSLERLDLSGCNFSGTIPSSFSNLSLIQLGVCYNNLTYIPPLKGSNMEIICIEGNHFTFDDVINAFSNLTSKIKVIRFDPQDSIYVDTTIVKKTKESLTIDLKIDPNVNNSTYKWYKSPNFNTPWRIIKGSNKLSINSLQTTDAGTYFVEVSNPIVDSNFHLKSHQINVVIQNTVDTSSCSYKDSLELIKLYKATNGPSWKNKWDTLQPMRTWYGVETNAEGCVTCLVLDGNPVGSCRTWRSTAQGNGLNGTLPTLDNGLKSLEYLNLNGNTALKGTLPENINKLENLIALWMYKCGISGPFPVGFWKMPALAEVDLSYNPLNTVIDSAIGTMPKLKGLSCINCGLKGSIPGTLGLKKEILDIILDNNQFSGPVPTNLNKILSLGKLGLSSNELTSLPDFSTLPFKPYGTGETTFFRVENNQLTFKHILPNLPLKSKVVSFSYAPQDSIYKDTSITIFSGKSLKIPLRIDQGIADNLYTWRKNGQLYTTFTGNDTLSFASIQAEDSGVYQVVVSNPRAPDLKLYGRKIRISVNVDTSSCAYQDRRELLKLYDATKGANWVNKWDLSKPMNTWFGVRVNAQGCVTCLDLDGVDDCQLSPNASNNGLTGLLPSLSFNDLETFITFRNEALGGPIPNLFMPNLKSLLLSSNDLHGSIPFFNMPKLENLALAGNKLEGSIPNFNYPNLKYISLNSNELSGNIPPLNLPELIDLTLFYNKIEGVIPNLNLPKLERIRINNNQLSGAVPNLNFPKLQDFRLHGNEQLSSLPLLTSLPKMGIDNDTHDSLTLANNQFTFKDIIPNIALINKMNGRIRYSPQAPFFQNTTFTKTVGQSLSIDLKIDSSISDNSYKWYKVGSKDTIILNTNKRTFNNLTLEDNGTYYVQVRNPQAPLLTLYSRAIQINVSDAGVLKSEVVNQKACSNSPIPLSFSSAITYAADNEFKVELSESPNNFSNAVIIGVLRSDKAQIINVSLSTNYSSQKNYYYRILASNPKVVSNISTFKINLESSIPAPIIKCAETTGNSITFSWEAVTGATGYQVRSLSGGSGVRNGNNITFSNLMLNASISLEVASQGTSSCPILRDTQTCNTLNCAEVVRSGEAEPPLFICENQNTPVILIDRLRDEDPNGRWSTHTGLNSQIFDAEAGILHPQSLKANQYRFTYTVAGKNGCPSSAQNILIIVGQKPKINQQEYSTCLNAKGKVQIQLSAVARSVNQQYAESIIWFRDPNKKDTLKQASLELAAPLMIYAQIGQGACASVLSPILLNPQPKLPLPVIEGQTVVNVGDTIKLRTTQKYPAQSLFNWKIIQGKKFTDIKVMPGRDLYELPPIIAAKSDAGVYALSVKAPTEPPVCLSDEASIKLEVRSVEDHQLNIGKIASKSNPWKIEGLGQYLQYQIQVFNRWGERVFHAKSEYLNPWEGTYNNTQLPQGTYYYQIDIPNLKPIKGAVYVL